MKFIASMALVATLGAAAPSQAQQVLTGDTRFACEAMLCLLSGQRPDECTPSLQRYFSIRLRRFNDTQRARSSFLNLCPASNVQNVGQIVAANPPDPDPPEPTPTVTSTTTSTSTPVAAMTKDQVRAQIEQQLPQYNVAHQQNVNAQFALEQCMRNNQSGDGCILERIQANAAAAPWNAMSAERQRLLALLSSP